MTREEAIKRVKGYLTDYLPIDCYEEVEEIIKVLEPRCKECKWWKDSDGKYRRGWGAESKCPINTHVVYCGKGYCYLYEPQESKEV